ncbi:hypothetical protein VTP01DRAFT_2480 [Rhizomucor pusillus]|uniref:uncharacterized protein n=1 Tax=Rhizomucor pusillus TaxID=4840 RepID=UPI003742A56E
MMAKFCEDHEIKTFQCMPLRTSWIPAHLQTDTKILATQMLKEPNNIDFDLDLWKQVVNFQSKLLQNQGADKSMAFIGTIFTDGDSGFGRKPKKTEIETKSDFTYIHDLDKTTLENIKPRTVFIDPGVEICYIVCIRTAPVRHRLPCVAKLSKHRAATVYIPKFPLYVKTRCEVSAVMSRHYQSLIYRKLRFRSYLYKKQADDKLAKAIRDQFWRRSCLNESQDRGKRSNDAGTRG